MQSKILTGNLTFKSLKPLDLSNFTRQQLCDYFENSYDLNESLFTALRDESVFYKCPDRLRLPLIFYFCHTSVVYVNKMILAGLLKERVNLEFETMFETGVDEMSWDDTENYRMGGSYKWPSVDEVVEYRQKVKNLVLKVIQDIPLELPVTMESPLWALIMGIEHERIHLETSSVLIRQLPVDMVVKPEGWVYAPNKSSTNVMENPMITVDEQTVTLGKPEDFPSYGWDNEYGKVDVRVPKFEASTYLITNREFLEFVNSGGYQNKKFWSEEGWKWRVFRQAQHPFFWICNNGCSCIIMMPIPAILAKVILQDIHSSRDKLSGCKGGCGADLSNYSHCHFPEEITLQTNGVGTNGKEMNGYHSNGVTDGHNNGSQNIQFMYRAMFDVISLPLDWPVDVNYHEARAFCAWKGESYRLPTEAEHVVMRGTQLPVNSGTKCDIIYNKKIQANLNMQFGSSTPVNYYPSNELGFHDVFGNVWEWTEDHFNGLDGYTSHWIYDDFSSPCFDGRHNIILGGSWVSTGDEASRFARFAFRRHFVQHAGFRIVKSVKQAQNIDVPARLINNEIFVLGLGTQEFIKPESQDNVEFHYVSTTNSQYLCDTEVALYGILEQEFGFRDNLPHHVAKHCLSLQKKYRSGTKSVVWFGAGAGSGPVQLTNVFQSVIGVDFCGRFVDTALKLQEGEEINYVSHSGEQKTAVLEGNFHPERVTFKQLTWIPNEITDHDLTVVTFLDRTQNAKAWLVRIWEITVQNGLVVVVSDGNTWNKDCLQKIFGDKLQFKEMKELRYNCPEGEKAAMATVWIRK